jgi:uncharacterized membrane protein required for colicin V production
MPTLNIADLTLGIIWLFFSFRGYMRGLVKEVGSLAAIITGFYCAGTYHRALAPKLTAYISGNYADTAAYLLIFTVALIAVWFLALAVSGIVKVTMTQWADRFFGGCFGLAKGVILTAVVLFLIHLAAPHPDFLKGSTLVPVLEKVSLKLVAYIPPDIHEKLRSFGKKDALEAVKPLVEKKAESKKAATPDKKAPAPDKTEAEKKTDEVPRPELEPKSTDQPHHETAKPTGASAKAVPNAKQTEPSKPEAKKAAPAATSSAAKTADAKAAAAGKTAPQPAADSEKKHE